MACKKYLSLNVYEATQKRIKYIFSEFDNILVAFSGGKDSGVLLNLAYDYAKKYNQLNKLGMYFLDYEAQYSLTIKYVKEMFDKFNDIKRYWLCLPNSVPSVTSMTTGSWIPWEKSKKDIWVRPMPKADYVINEDNVGWDYKTGSRDYDVQEDFTKWFSSQHGKTAVLIGIRTDESLDRFRAIKSDRKINSYKGKEWIVGKDSRTINAYPIYDWSVEDIWICNGKQGFKYNHLYDLYYQAGMKITDMRVASPFISEGISDLHYYQVIEPDTWGKVLGRVNGANFANIYGKTSAMGRGKDISLPKGMTWKKYFNFLISTLPATTKNKYKEKLKKLIGVSPNFKKMCIAIMKNDYTMKHLNTSQIKQQKEKRKKTIAKYSKLL